MIKISVVIPAIINFIILYLILRHFFFKPVMNVLESREKSIGDNISKAKQEAEKAELLRKENEKLIKEAKEEGKKITEKQRQKAEKLYQDILAEANKEAQLTMERANIEIEREREKARNELKKEVVDLAVMLSAKALEESIDENKHKQLINDFISKVGI